MTAPSAASRLARLGAQPLYVISTLAPGDSIDQELWALHLAVEGGARLFQLRVKQADSAARRDWLGRCRDTLPDDVLLIVNDDLEAVFGDDGTPLADGLHLGREDAATLGAGSDGAGLTRARERLGPDLLLGSSARHLDELRAALAAGADHVGFGALFPSLTKPEAPPAEPEELRRCVAALPDVPTFAIGGVSPDNLAQVVALGCRRAAVGAAILRSDDPAEATAACLAALTSSS